MDGLKLPVNGENNYFVSYLGNNIIEFKDTATSFSAKYEAVYDGIDKAMAEKRLQHLNEIKGSEISSNFYDMKLINNNSGASLIRCSKYIPGITRNGVLGIIEYTFESKHDKYYLSSEALKSIDLQNKEVTIKSQVFTQ